MSDVLGLFGPTPSQRQPEGLPMSDLDIKRYDLILKFVTTLVVVGGAIVAYFQWRTQEDQRTQQQKQFQDQTIEQRKNDDSQRELQA